MTNEDMTHVREIAGAVVNLLADRGLVVYAGPTPSARVLKAREVARLLGLSLPGPTSTRPSLKRSAWVAVRWPASGSTPPRSSIGSATTSSQCRRREGPLAAGHVATRSGRAPTCIPTSRRGTSRSIEDTIDAYSDDRGRRDLTWGDQHAAT
jgi:hypothetical protein